MSTEKRVILVVSAAVILLVLLLFSSEVVEREVAPEPRRAWVAIEVADSGVARTGPVSITSETPFRLHAVVEAETFSGETIYYSEAGELEIQGRRIPSKAVKVWNRPTEPRILWFTVEGYKPYLEIDSESALDQFRFQENFRADWPRTWSIPGDLSPRGERDLRSDLFEGLSRFGTQRYHVRVEFYGPKSEITPLLRVQSDRATSLPPAAASFATVEAHMPGAAAASKVYGLSQIEPDPSLLATVAERLADLHGRGLAFSRLTLLREILERSETTYDELQWSAVELGVDRKWDAGQVASGDLLRVGNRWVVLLQDRGLPGILDREDLCLDFDKGASLRRVGEVFTGDGLVEWTKPTSGSVREGG